MAALGCHFVECCLYVLVVNIEKVSFIALQAQAVVYKTGPVVLSSTFYNWSLSSIEVSVFELPWAVLFWSETLTNKTFVVKEVIMLKQVRIIAIVLLTFIAAQAQATQSAQDYFRSASAHLRANEFAEALADYNKVIELDPTHTEALFYRLMALNNLDPLAEPIGDWDRIIELAPRYKLIWAIYLQRANYRARVGKFDGSIEDINKALEFVPNNGAAYYLRSYSYLMKGNLEVAYADYKKSVELKTIHQNALLTRGWLFKFGREFERAVADYTMALEWNPNDAIAYVDRGTTYVLMGKTDLGLADIKKGMTIDRISIVERGVEGFGCPFCELNGYVERYPLDARVYEARGILRLLQQQESEAKIEFDKSISLAPNLKSEIERVIREVRTWQ